MKNSNTISLQEFRRKGWWQEPQSHSQLQEVCRKLKDELGMTVLYLDCTLDDVARFGAGVKVVVPEMLPISVPTSIKWLGCPRLAKHAEKHSLQFASNPFPHPFP